MTETTSAALQSWITRWDRQQEFYLPYREERYGAMLAVLRHLVARGRLSPTLRVLDLGCGPGAIGQRVLEHFPLSSYVGLDIDPALLELAKAAESTFGDRFTVVQRDLALTTWSLDFANGEFDVVASSTALHWLEREELEQVCKQIFRLLRPDGLFLNADNLAFSSTYWQDVADSADREQQEQAASIGREDWGAWWSAARRDPYLAPFVAERDRRFPPRDDDDSSENPPPPLADYLSALKEAGFTDIDVLWQRMDDRLLAARRPA